MNILILDPDSQRRQVALEALGGFAGNTNIHQAANQPEADRLMSGQDYDLILIGPGLEMGMLLTVMYLRRRFPLARLVVIDNLSSEPGVFPGHLEAAGCHRIICGKHTPSQLFDLILSAFTPHKALAQEQVPA